MNISQEERIEAARERLLKELAEFFKEEDSDNEKLVYLAKNYNLVSESLLSIN